MPPQPAQRGPYDKGLGRLGSHALLWALLTFGLLAATFAEAQSPFKFLSSSTRFRDAAIDLHSGVVFLAAYKRNEVWGFDPQTHKRITRLATGQRPAYLAISPDGKILACVNEMDGTVSLIRWPEAELYATVPVGRGPADIAALPGGQFAVPDSIDDTVTIIDPARPEEPLATGNVPKTPIGVAATAEWLGIIGEKNQMLRLLRLGDSSDSHEIPLPGTPTVIASFGSQRLAIGTESQLVIVDTESAKIVETRAMTVRGLAGNGNLHVLTGRRLRSFDSKLDEIGAFELERPATRLSVSGDVYVILNTRRRTWQIWNAGSLALQIANVPAKGTIGPTSGQPQHRFQRNPLAGAELRAPRTGLHTSTPLSGVSKRSIHDVLSLPTQFGSEGSGFQAPDWTKPLQDVKADHGSSHGDTGITYLDGSVRLTLGNMGFQADSFTHNRNTGEMHAVGNVRVQQEDSWFTAREVHYWPPSEEEEAATVSVLESPAAKQEWARKRLSLGRVDALDPHISEPTRELIADRIHYDFGSGAGGAENVRGRAGIFFFATDKLEMSGHNCVEANDFWITTCDRHPPHYKFRAAKLKLDEQKRLTSLHSRLQFGPVPLLYIPWIRGDVAGGRGWNADFDTGHQANLGYFFETGVQFDITPNVQGGPRLYPTSEEGIGAGLDLSYNFMENPASYLYRTKGRLHTLYFTKDRGYTEWYHRYDHMNNLVALSQLEIYSDKDFYKDFYYDKYKRKSEPRSFLNITYRRPTYLATATAKLNTNRWVDETERLPEATFHLIDRKIANKLYFTFDTAAGYNKRDQSGDKAGRLANIARLTYDFDPHESVNLTPFAETEITGYTSQRDSAEAAARVSGTVGATLQSRVHREFPGLLGFSGFKHVVLPSLTLSYRSPSTMGVEDTPRFDALDNTVSRMRIETKLDNVLYGRDRETEQVWQVARLSLYQGHDLWNENRVAEDYEIEIAVQPRPWWGYYLVGERHVITGDLDQGNPFPWASGLLEDYRDILGRPGSNSQSRYNASYGDYDRVLTQLFYDDTPIDGNVSGRIGFSFTQTNGRVFNRDILYGAGYRITEKWGVSFEHVFDISSGALREQTYEIRRALHCWEATLSLRERESGFDVRFEFNIRAFPGSKLKI